MIQLFTQTQSLRAIGLQLSVLCEELHQISLNAAISASHLEGSTSQFPVLAQQIGKVARTISDNLEEMDRVTTTAANCILEALQSSFLASKFLVARELHTETIPELENSTAETFHVITRERDCYLESISALLRQVRNIEQAFTKSWGIVPYLRIAVHSSGLDQMESFLDIATKIDELNESSQSLIRELRRTLQSAEQLARFEVSTEGLSNAA